MTSIPRRSVAPSSQQSGLRKSSSASGPDLLSQGSSSQGKAPVVSMGRSSSIDGRASMAGRASSIGGAGLRASICNFKTTDGKTITPADLASDVLKVLQDLDYSHMPVSMKIILLPSTSLFYSVFEFFLKLIGIEDVWNSDYLTANQPPNKNGQQTNQSNVVAQNKLRIELIIFYLEILKFNNVPKATILQTMTTPKNWTHMLQIMQFLAQDCWFLVCYDAEKVCTSFSPNFRSNQLIYDYCQQAYAIIKNDPSFMGNDRHKQMKEELFKRYQQYMRGDNNLKELEDTLAGENKKLNHVIEVKESFEIFIKEERELIETVNESTRRSTTFQTESEERNKRLKLKKQKNAELKAILKKMEEEAAIKEAHHDRQMNKGQKVTNLHNRHSQKGKELESLQTIFVDLEEKKDEIQMQLMNKTLEEKEVISKINEMVTKIKLSSSLEINEFPQFDILDFHKKNDLIKQYKESLISIRIEYNENMCKLPEELIQCQEKRKLMESKIAAFDVENSTIEAKKQSDENYFRKIREESENLKLALSEKMNENVHGLTDLENKLSQAIKEVDALIIKLGQIEENQKRIKDDQIQEIKLVQESYVNTEKHEQEKLEIFEKECVENINGKSTLLCEFEKKLRMI